MNFIWAVIISSIIFNRNLTPATVIELVDGLSCNYCNYISKQRNQVSSHISTVHRDKMTDMNRREKMDLPIAVRINNLRSIKPFERYNYLSNTHKDHEEANIPSNSNSATSKSS